MPKNTNPTIAELLAVAMAEGIRLSIFARDNNLNVRSVYRLAEKPGVKAAAAKIRGRMVDAAVGRLSKAADVAAVTLIQLMAEDRDDAKIKRDGVRMAAASKVLAALPELGAIADVHERIAALEAGSKDKKAPHA